MSKRNFFKLVVSVAGAELAGVIGSVFTVSAIPGWYATLVKPTINPPSWVFGPVWITLYALMGISFFLVWNNKWNIQNHIFAKKQKAWNVLSERLWAGSWRTANIIAIFGIQLALNGGWTFLFFGLRNAGLAFFEILALWVAIFYTIVNFYRVSKPAAWLLAPYILWVSFAAYLNYQIWVLN